MTLASTRRKVSRRAIRLVPYLRNLLPAPAIRIAEFPRRHPELFVPAGPRPEGTGLVSQLCRLATLESPAFRDWLDRLHDVWHMHRKNWEHAYICQALHERSLLQPGRRGLGFAVGTEKLPSLFAALGCRVTATDLAADDDRNHRWARNGQWAGSLEALNAAGLCPADEFRDQRVVFRGLDCRDGHEGDLKHATIGERHPLDRGVGREPVYRDRAGIGELLVGSDHPKFCTWRSAKLRCQPPRDVFRGVEHAVERAVVKIVSHDEEVGVPDRIRLVPAVDSGRPPATG